MEILAALVDRLDRAAKAGTRVIPWACPVPSFGDLSRSRVATLGLNPSNREFVDEFGNELQGAACRFHTLKSLDLESWSDVDSRHLHLILDSCGTYSDRNPYDKWFKKLDQVVAGTSTSYYDATRGDTLGLLLRDAPVKTLILNGQGVVDQFQEMAGIRFERYGIAECSLRRETSAGVAGFAYRGLVDSLSGISLGRNLLVLGFNHNVQCSFGVTGNVISSMRGWIAAAVSEAIN
jgi:hypothetical protein